MSEDAADKPSASVVEDTSIVVDGAAPSKNKKTARGRSSMGSAPKKSADPASHSKFEPGDIVLARLKGYPPWPARITGDDDLPANVLAQRKSANLFCAQFFPAGDFSWLAAKDCSLLSKEDIAVFLKEGHRKKGSLLEAYHTALDPTEWDAAQAEARKVQEEAAVDEDVDELEEEEEDGATSGKRKRAAAAVKKEKKKPKTEKVKVTAPEETKPKAKATKAKVDKKVEKVESSAPVADDDPMASDPEAAKVKDWRHKLQRAFLGKGLPQSEEMETYDQLLKTIESYTDMTIQYLQYSKIGKVMKKIATLEGIPRNDELKITSRANKLMNEWSEFIQKNESSAPKSESKVAETEAPNVEANGEAAKLEGESAAPAATEPIAVEPAAEPEPEPAAKEPEAAEAVSVDAAAEVAA